MKITISNIPEEGLSTRFSRDGSWFIDSAKGVALCDLSLEKADVECSIKRIGETLLLKGKIDTEVVTDCCRCLDQARIPINVEFSYTLMPAKDEFEEESELSSEELEFLFYRDDNIDLDPLILEQVMLFIPLKPLCKELCKGLCPQCGINLNLSNCNCRTHFVNARMAVLKNLKV